MDRLYVFRCAPYDFYIAPIASAIYGIYYHVFLHLYLPGGLNSFLGKLWPMSAAIAGLIGIYFANSLYFLKSENDTVYFYIRLILQTSVIGVYSYQDSQVLTLISKVDWNWLGSDVYYIAISVGMYALIEAREIKMYEHMKTNEMDKIYRRKNWDFIGFPVTLLLYGQVLCSVRYVALLLQLSEKQSIPDVLHKDWVHISMYMLLVFLLSGLTINGALLLVAVRTKSTRLLNIYYNIKMVGYIPLVTVATSLIIVTGDLFYTGKSEPLADGLNGFAIPLLESFELAQILRFCSYLTLESEMSVGKYTFSLQQCKPGHDFFSSNFNKSARRFLNSVRISSARIRIDSKMLGEGQFAKVFKGSILLLPTFKRRAVAIKVMKGVEMEDFEAVITELKILSFVSNCNENLVGFLGCCKLSDNHLGVILEYVGSGSLLMYLQKLKKSDNWDVQNLFSTWCKEIATGMEFLSAKKIIHGDLAARNILLTDDLKCKISDFGMAFRLRQYQNYATSTQTVMPFRWMAPESLSDLKFSTKSDVWSYAVLVWEIYSLGNVPWSEISDWNSDFVKSIQNGLKLQKPFLASEILYNNILLKCWELNGNDRPDFGNIKIYLQIEQCFDATCV